ncbi:SDR family NAD(P)-dependent oxidoreductase [Dongia sp.]|uniref:SDR family NAD(P)-dependent oxidoreductase n=1 Tax=Dongia sp. TaxID=1977262 RepID=UPI0035B2936B
MSGSTAPKNVLIVGATSAIAEQLARLYAAEGASLLLVGRNETRLEQIATNLRVLGATDVSVHAMDIVSSPDIEAQFVRIVGSGAVIDHAFIAHGYLGDQGQSVTDPEELDRQIDINLRSIARWMMAVRAILLRQGHGTLVIFGSVAGDRGRRANYVYGAMKAAAATLIEGMAHEFAADGPRAIIVKIGPTDTPMTAGFEKKGLLWADAARVARRIRKAADGKAVIVYAPGFWRWIMLVIRHLPSAIFNRLSI